MPQELTELQQQVFDRAYEILKDRPWFRGVCMDSFKTLTDQDILREGVEEQAQDVAFETAMWDDPDFYNFF